MLFKAAYTRCSLRSRRNHLIHASPLTRFSSREMDNTIDVTTIEIILNLALMLLLEHLTTWSECQKHKFQSGFFSFPEDVTNVILFPMFIAPLLSCIVIHWKCIQRCVSVESPGVIRVNGVEQFFQLLFIQSAIREESLELIKGELSIICRGNRDLSCTHHS